MAHSFFRERKRAPTLPTICLGLPAPTNRAMPARFTFAINTLELFAQDSWRIRPNLTLNYGMRWDVLPPWREKYNQLQTFVLGQQSQVYPGAPQGIVFPGDRGHSEHARSHRLAQFCSAHWDRVFATGEDGLIGKTLRRRGQKQYPRGLGNFSQRVRRFVGRNHERLRSLRIRL